MAYEPNKLPEIPDTMRRALDELQDAATLNGEGQCKYSTVRDRRFTIEQRIVGAIYETTREAYAAGLAAQVTK